MRRTKIVATLGPATDAEGMIERIISAGVDVVRLNAAHSGPEALAVRLKEVREAARKAGREIGVLVDLPGPKLRVGEVEAGTSLESGQEFTLMSNDCVGDTHHACVTYQELADDLTAGDRILIDDGRIELQVTDTHPGEVLTEVRVGGVLSSNKGVNVPGVTLSIDAITDYDREVLKWALTADVDWVGQSFVRSADDVEALRSLMGSRKLPIIAKIEKHEATSDIDAIVEAADAVMVARGDLGVETSPEQVPVLQRLIVAAARAAGKPVVVATEMLDSMRTRPRPTRAEASDVANAIFNRADAVMLSGETAVGEYPVESVETMARIAVTAEQASPPPRPPRSAGSGDDVQQAVSAAVEELAEDLGVTAIVTLTQSGGAALAVSRWRPQAAIVAATPSTETCRLLSIAWGVQAMVLPFSENTNDLLDEVTAKLRDKGLVESGDMIAITAGLSARTIGGTDFIHVRQA
jgi:pyruvate kinase